MTAVSGLSTENSSKGEGGAPFGKTLEGGSPWAQATVALEGVEVRLSVQDKKIEDLEQRAENVLLSAGMAGARADSALAQAENINTRTAQVLIVVILAFLGVIVAFVVCVYGIWMDYSRSNDENRKYFFDLLKDYETKESSAANLKEFKDCLWYEGTKFCTRPR